jgi:hypothetical protein
VIGGAEVCSGNGESGKTDPAREGIDTGIAVAASAIIARTDIFTGAALIDRNTI